MKMQPVENIPVPASGSVELKPGSLHVMLFGLNKELKTGDTFPLTLQVRKGRRADGAGPGQGAAGELSRESMSMNRLRLSAVCACAGTVAACGAARMRSASGRTSARRRQHRIPARRRRRRGAGGSAPCRRAAVRRSARLAVAARPRSPSRGTAEMDAYLVTAPRASRSRTAKVTFDTDMTNMSHGLYLVPAQPAGDGHYVGQRALLDAGSLACDHHRRAPGAGDRQAAFRVHGERPIGERR